MAHIKALILAAGYATRLYPLTKDKPKALLDIAGKTMLDHIKEKIEQMEEINEIIIVTNDTFYKNFNDWKNISKSIKKITIINDGTRTNEERLGAVGDIDFVLKGRGCDETLVIASDNLFGFSLEEMMKLYRQKKAAVIALFDIGDKSKASKKYGIAVLNKENRIENFEEKPEHPKTSLVATCCYILPKESIKKVALYRQQMAKHDNPGDFISWLAKREPVYGFTFKEHWFDIGGHDALEEARTFYKKERGSSQ